MLQYWERGAAHVAELGSDQDTSEYILYKHGRELHVGPLFECMAYLHNVCNNSVAWATAHDGYTLVEITTEAK